MEGMSTPQSSSASAMPIPRPLDRNNCHLMARLRSQMLLEEQRKADYDKRRREREQVKLWNADLTAASTDCVRHCKAMGDLEKQLHAAISTIETTLAKFSTVSCLSKCDYHFITYVYNLMSESLIFSQQWKKDHDRLATLAFGLKQFRPEPRLEMMSSNSSIGSSQPSPWTDELHHPAGGVAGDRDNCEFSVGETGVNASVDESRNHGTDDAGSCVRRDELEAGERSTEGNTACGGAVTLTNSVQGGEIRPSASLVGTRSESEIARAEEHPCERSEEAENDTRKQRAIEKNSDSLLEDENAVFVEVFEPISSDSSSDNVRRQTFNDANGDPTAAVSDQFSTAVNCSDSVNADSELLSFEDVAAATQLDSPALPTGSLTMDCVGPYSPPAPTSVAAQPPPAPQPQPSPQSELSIVSNSTPVALRRSPSRKCRLAVIKAEPASPAPDKRAAESPKKTKKKKHHVDRVVKVEAVAAAEETSVDSSILCEKTPPAVNKDQQSKGTPAPRDPREVYCVDLKPMINAPVKQVEAREEERSIHEGSEQADVAGEESGDADRMASQQQQQRSSPVISSCSAPSMFELFEYPVKSLAQLAEEHRERRGTRAAAALAKESSTRSAPSASRTSDAEGLGSIVKTEPQQQQHPNASPANLSEASFVSSGRNSSGGDRSDAACLVVNSDGTSRRKQVIIKQPRPFIKILQFEEMKSTAATTPLSQFQEVTTDSDRQAPVPRKKAPTAGLKLKLSAPTIAARRVLFDDDDDDETEEAKAVDCASSGGSNQLNNLLDIVAPPLPPAIPPLTPPPPPPPPPPIADFPPSHAASRTNNRQSSHSSIVSVGSAHSVGKSAPTAAAAQISNGVPTLLNISLPPVAPSHSSLHQHTVPTNSPVLHQAAPPSGKYMAPPMQHPMHMMPPHMMHPQHFGMPIPPPPHPGAYMQPHPMYPPQLQMPQPPWAYPSPYNYAGAGGYHPGNFNPQYMPYGRGGGPMPDYRNLAGPGGGGQQQQSTQMQQYPPKRANPRESSSNEFINKKRRQE